MKDRTLAVIITFLVILFFACPGLAFLCFGVTDFIDHYWLNSYFYGIYSQNAANIWGIVGICSGILFIMVAIVVSILVLRRKNNNTPPPKPNEPIPPTI
jgi:multisubunit Na+/H+ antiporter MnhB subunit